MVISIRKPLTFLALIVLLSSCFISNDLLNQFRVFNQSFERSSQMYIKSNLDFIKLLKTGTSNTNLFVKEADSLHTLTLNLYFYIDSLKNVMTKRDSVGADEYVSQSLLVNTNSGKSLVQKSSAVYSFTSKIITEKSVRDTSIYKFKALEIDSVWVNKMFRGGPTIAGICTLSKIQNISLQSEKQSLMDLRSQLK